MRVRAVPATICWGLAVWIAGWSPQGGQGDRSGGPPPATAVPPAAKSRNAVPTPPPFVAAWSVNLPATTHVTVAGALKQVFVGLDDGPVTAYALADGQKVWSAAIKPAVDLVACDGSVLVAELDTLHALSQSDGAERWKTSISPLAVKPACQSGWLFTSSKDGTLAAWRSNDGTKVWSQSVGAAASASMAVDGERLFVPLTDSRIVSCSVVDGELVW